MTLGRISEIRLVTVFDNGTSNVQNVCWGKMVDEETVANIVKITDALNKQDFFHDDQMIFRLGDLKIRDNTRNVKYDDARYTFDEDVATEIDKIQIKLVTPSKNPFTYEVKRQDDEYIIRGYANVEKMNKAGMVDLADRWNDATFDELFSETKRYVIQASSKYRPNFPGIKGYVEGKAVITPSGDIEFSFHEGRTYVESDFFYQPKKLFDLSYYCEWTAAFEGQITSIFEIKPPDNGGDSKAVFNFNLVESSWVHMNVRTAHNGLSLDIGVYAVKVSLEGKMEDANYNRNSIHRPYATDELKFQWKAWFETGGDLYEKNYNRIITSPSDVDIEEGNMKKWYSWFKRPGEDAFYQRYSIQGTSPNWGTSKVSSFGMMSDSANANSYYQDDIFPILLASAFGLSGRSGNSMEIDKDELSAVQYYNGNEGIIYIDNAKNIVTSSIDGNSKETVDEKAFGLDIASVENGNTLAAWGSYKGVLDTDDLNNMSKDEILKYASGKIEIKAGIFNGTNWNITTLTNNEMADIIPKTATNGSDGVVVWTQGILNDKYEGEGQVMEFSKNRLMFAQYKDSAWGSPEVLYTSSSGDIIDYSVAMAGDGSAIVVMIMSSGKIAIVKISEAGEVTVINNSLPTTRKASLVYNGKNYMLACSLDDKDAENRDSERMGLALYEIDTDGFIRNTTFSGIARDISEDFKLYRNWSKPAEAVLIWSGSSKDDSEARSTIYASKVYKVNSSDNTILVLAPMAVTNINMPISITDDEGEAFTTSYDAYITGDDLKILTVYGESTSENSVGSVYLNEVQGQFKNTIEITPDINDISDLMPGSQANFNIQVKNTGFEPITMIKTEIGGEIVTKDVNILPNEDTTVTATFTLTKKLPDNIDYNVTATFKNGSEARMTDSISLLQTDISVELMSFMQESNNYNIKALISNNTPFSLADKTVVVGIYKDSFGTIPITEEKEIAGMDFESETLGTSVFLDFTFTDTKNLPQSLYLIAKVYDSSNKEIPDKNSMNNILSIRNMGIVMATTPDDNSGNNGGGSGGSGGGGGGAATTQPIMQPTIPSSDGSVKVEYTRSNGVASLSINNTKVNEIIAKAKNGEVVFDLQAIKDTNSVKIPKNALSSFEKAKLDIAIKLPEGTVTIDNKALASILKQSTGTADMKLELKQIPTSNLSAAQKESLNSGDLVFDINILMGTKNITEFDGALTIELPYKGDLPVAVWYLNDKGELGKVESSYKNGVVSFVLNHLSLYVLGKDNTIIGTEDKWINPFIDVKEDSWYYDAVRYVYENGLMKGTSDKNFSPDEKTTRGMIVTILHRLEGSPSAETNRFSDVKEDKYYAKAVAWAAENNIVNGYGNDKFGPEDAITREQLAVILMNYAKNKGYDVSAKANLSKYVDSEDISNWALDAISWANATGLIEGSENSLAPLAEATRAQVAAVLNRLVEDIVK